MAFGMIKSMVLGLAASVAAHFSWADLPNVSFPSIDGGSLELKDWEGQPILVVNTASQCAFTKQYDGLQMLYDRYRAQGLVVLAIPSDDFNQELNSADEVKAFCEMNFATDLPMTDILPVRGAKAHPFYQSIKAQIGFEPRWNFNKVLIDRGGAIIATWGSSTKPMSQEVVRMIEAAL